jgi:rRNA maturation endonuclease Nob1
MTHLTPTTELTTTWIERCHGCDGGSVIFTSRHGTHAPVLACDSCGRDFSGVRKLRERMLVAELYAQDAARQQARGVLA